MTWYMQPAAGDDRSKHLGRLRRSMIDTLCGKSFPTSSAVRINLPPGGSPADDEICPLCATGQAHHVADADVDPRPVPGTALLGTIRDAVRGYSRADMAMVLGWLIVAALAVFIWVAWPR